MFPGYPQLTVGISWGDCVICRFLVFWWFKSTGIEDIPLSVRFLVTFVFTMWFIAASLNGVKTQPDATMQRYVVGTSAILVVTGVGVSRLLASAGVAVYQLVLKRRSCKNTP